jgi:hypothetical protein
MPTVHEELLRLVSELRKNCEEGVAASLAFPAIRELCQAIGQKAATMDVWELAKEIGFKAVDLYREPRLQEEFLLRGVIGERINRLEATIRAGPQMYQERRQAITECEFRRRWSDQIPSPVG